MVEVRPRCARLISRWILVPPKTAVIQFRMPSKQTSKSSRISGCRSARPGRWCRPFEGNRLARLAGSVHGDPQSTSRSLLTILCHEVDFFRRVGCIKPHADFSGAQFDIDCVSTTILMTWPAKTVAELATPAFGEIVQMNSGNRYANHRPHLGIVMLNVSGVVGECGAVVFDRQ